jgi:Cof subfamily protein (haloacid dehalogenase superfamily)
VSSQKKLIAIDLDGTMLNREKKISKRTKQVLHKAMERGHHVVIATGRPPRASLMYYHELNLKTPIVNFNGALVHHALDEAWGHHHFPLEREQAIKVLETCETVGIHNVMVEVKDDFYLKNHDHEMIRLMGDGMEPLGIGHLPQLVQDHPTAMLIRPDHATLKQLREHLHLLHADIIEHRMWGAPWNMIEIIKAGVSKATGLEVIAKDLGVDRENIVAFGDEDNDLEMIQYAGIGVAMGNAIAELKSVANHITDTNDNDGIALFLEKLL